MNTTPPAAADAVPLPSANAATQSSRSGWYYHAKRPVGFVLALAIALISLPPGLLIWWAVTLEGRPVLIRRQRLGLGERPFYGYTFRTMTRHANTLLSQQADNLARSGHLPNLIQVRTPRMSALGRFLEASCLDRLPLLWNVLKGDMALVGPHALTQEEALRHGRQARPVLRFRPGLTGLWWIAGDGDPQRRLALDRSYCEHLSPWRDARIVLVTFLRLFRAWRTHAPRPAAEQTQSEKPGRQEAAAQASSVKGGNLSDTVLLTWERRTRTH